MFSYTTGDLEEAPIKPGRDENLARANMSTASIRCLIESSPFRIHMSLTLKQSTVDVGLKIGSTHSCDEHCV